MYYLRKIYLYPSSLIAQTKINLSFWPEYSELALECRQKVKPKNYFAHVSNSTTKFLSVFFLLHRNQIQYIVFIFIKEKTWNFIISIFILSKIFWRIPLYIRSTSHGFLEQYLYYNVSCGSVLLFVCTSVSCLWKSKPNNPVKN